MDDNIVKKQSFIDWMKATGMFLIVFGHLVVTPFHQLTQPVYPKQLGVAFFVFVTAWSLANANRDSLKVLYDRIFPVFFIGISFSLFLSAVFLFEKNDANLSNYMPYVMGVNVFFNYFPANPTTWYIGTFLHIVLVWYFFLQKKIIPKKYIALVFIFEIVIRSILMASGKLMVSYMVFPNWITIFFLGSYFCKKKDVNPSFKKIISIVTIWMVFTIIWLTITNLITFDNSFPFRQVVNSKFSSHVLTSLLISFVYIAHTLLCFFWARSMPHLRVISFFSRNTLIVFIFHMPFIYKFSPVVYSYFDSIVLAKVLMFIACYVGLSLFSEFFIKLIKLTRIKNIFWVRLNRLFERDDSGRGIA